MEHDLLGGERQHLLRALWVDVGLSRASISPEDHRGDHVTCERYLRINDDTGAAFSCVKDAPVHELDALQHHISLEVGG